MLISAKKTFIERWLHVTRKDIFIIDVYVRRDCALVCH